MGGKTTGATSSAAIDLPGKQPEQARFHSGIVPAGTAIADKPDILESDMDSTRVRRIGHDMGNALVAMNVGLQYLRLEGALKGSPLEEVLDDFVGAVHHLGDLVLELQATTSRKTMGTRIGNVHEAVVRARPIAFIDRPNQLVCVVEKGLWPIKMPTADLARVLANLLTNAREASLANGGVELRAKNVQQDNGCRVLLEVQDWGKGVGPEELNRIRKLGYSTKGRNRGLGLGVVAEIMSRHEGEWCIQSLRGQGTTVTLIIPADKTAL